MEIIHLILGKANPERMNGVNKVVHQLATQQYGTGRKVEVWGITKDPTPNYGHRNFKTRLYQASKFPFHFDEKLKSDLLSLGKNSIVHLHGGWIPVFSSIAIFLKKHNIPFIITPHGAYNSIAMKKNYWVKRIYFRLFERRLLNYADKIHAIGASELKGLESIYPCNKSTLLPYGYSSSIIQKASNKQNDEFIIGFVGRLDIHTKGLDLLLQAFDIFHRQHPKSNLWIVGDSAEKPQLQREIQAASLENNVVLWGSKYGHEKDHLMAQMHVFAHPSRNEGLPSSVLEACYMGTPGIVTEATNLGEYIQKYKAGISIPDNHVQALADAFIALHEEWKLNQLISYNLNARWMVREAFNWKHILNQFDKVYAPVGS